MTTQDYEAYETLKQEIERVDRKYSMSYHEPEMNLPESLELEMLEYTPLTDEELMTLAESKVNGWYVTESDRVMRSYENELRHLTGKRANALSNYLSKTSRINRDATAKVNTLRSKVINNGAFNGNVVDGVLGNLQEQVSTSLDDAFDSYQAKTDGYDDEEEQITTSKNNRLEALLESKQARILDVFNGLKAKDEKYVVSVDKYNQTLNEKETKYQASCQKALEYAREEEYARALDASRLYAELGESGVDEQKRSEKLSLAKFFFANKRREDAMELIESDTFMAAHLGLYYDYLVDFIGNLPSRG